MSQTPKPPNGSADRESIYLIFDLLAALWPRLDDALARDDVGTGTGAGRSASGGSKSKILINEGVLTTKARIESGMAELEVEVTRILNGQPTRLGPVCRSCAHASCKSARRQQANPSNRTIVTMLPIWCAKLTDRGLPVDEILGRPASGWIAEIRRTLRADDVDKPAGINCPDHRDEKLTELQRVGDRAHFDTDLIAGPPAFAHGRVGPACRRCDHESCEEIRLGMCTVGNWRWRAGHWTWHETETRRPYVWKPSKTIRCPFCRRTWRTTKDKRDLCKELDGLGDRLRDSAILEVRTG